MKYGLSRIKSLTIGLLGLLVCVQCEAAASVVAYNESQGSCANSPVCSIQATVVREHPTVAVNQSFWIAGEILFPSQMRSGWHLPLGDWPATRLQLRLAKPLAIRQVLWPLPKVDLSGTQPQIYYDERVTVLFEIVWRPQVLGGRPKDHPAMEAQLLVDGQARWLGQLHSYAFNRLAMLPTLRLPNEVPYPQDPLAVSTFRRARHFLPDALDPAQVDWVGRRDQIQLQVHGMTLNPSVRWIAAAHRVRSDIVDPIPTPVVLLSHLRVGEKDIFTLKRSIYNEWLHAGVEAIILVDEHGSQGWVVVVEQALIADNSLVDQVSTWCQDMLDQINQRLK